MGGGEVREVRVGSCWVVGGMSSGWCDQTATVEDGLWAVKRAEVKGLVGGLLLGQMVSAA